MIPTILIGLVCIAAAVFTFWRTKKADAVRDDLMKKVSPEKAHPGVIMYAKISRLIFVVGVFGLGIFCVAMGTVGLVR